MSQAPQRSDEFAKRLQRIEGAGGGGAAAMPETAVEGTPEASMPMPARGSARGISSLRIGLILLTMLGIFAMGAVTILNFAEGREQASVKPVVVRR